MTDLRELVARALSGTTISGPDAPSAYTYQRVDAVLSAIGERHAIVERVGEDVVAQAKRREAAPTAEQMLGAYEAEINSRGIPPVAGPEYRAARLSLIRGTLARLPTPPQPDPVAAAREAVVKAAMDRHNFQGGALDACDAVERKLDEACAALREREEG